MTRRKRKCQKRQLFEYSTSDQSILVDKRLCTDQQDKVNSSEQKSNSVSNNMKNSLQQTPLASSPYMTYPQNCSPIFFPPTGFPPPIMQVSLSPGIEGTLKELCQKMTNVELKLSKLDKIEERLNIIDK